MPINAATTSIRIPGDLLDRFDRLANRTERTRSYHVVKALAAYIAEQEYLNALFTDLKADADSDRTAIPNDEAVSSAIASGLVRAEDLDGPDPVSDAEYAAVQTIDSEWR